MHTPGWSCQMDMAAGPICFKQSCKNCFQRWSFNQWTLILFSINISCVYDDVSHSVIDFVEPWAAPTVRSTCSNLLQHEYGTRAISAKEGMPWTKQQSPRNEQNAQKLNQKQTENEGMPSIHQKKRVKRWNRKYANSKSLSRNKNYFLHSTNVPRMQQAKPLGDWSRHTNVWHKRNTSRNIFCWMVAAWTYTKRTKPKSCDRAHETFQGISGVPCALYGTTSHASLIFNLICFGIANFLTW